MTFYVSPTTPTQTPGVFQLYDSDHDGYITREELEGVVSAMHRMLGHMTTLREADEENEEEEEEFESPQERVAHLMETMDTVRPWKHSDSGSGKFKCILRFFSVSVSRIKMAE